MESLHETQGSDIENCSRIIGELRDQVSETVKSRGLSAAFEALSALKKND